LRTVARHERDSFAAADAVAQRPARILVHSDFERAESFAIANQRGLVAEFRGAFLGDPRRMRSGSGVARAMAS